MRKRSRRTQGLDQLGPARSMVEEPVYPHRPGSSISIAGRQKIAVSHSKRPITLSDHLFSSDEIKTKDDTDG